MLRAIAGYILGGILNDSPQENVECETREVNDWLVVNMPNKPDENDLDFESETESVIDEDDILSCLSTLMASHELQANDSCFGKEQFEEIARASYISEEELFRNCELLHQNPSPQTDVICVTFDYDLFDDGMDDIDPFDDSDMSEMARKAYRKLLEKYPPEPNPKREKLVQKVKPQDREARQKDKNSNLTCHSIHTPTYINHRPPITAAKTDLLQQIKDLQPSQRAKEIAAKKQITRSSLNRQNKNYIFCSSAKTNRRKDLQRNHSGANNNRNMNRKC